MYSEERIVGELENFLGGSFQYCSSLELNVKGFISHLQRQYAVFRPFTEFEKSVLNMNTPKKLFIKMYNLLLSFKNVVDTARNRWDHDLHVEISV